MQSLSHYANKMQKRAFTLVKLYAKHSKYVKFMAKQQDNYQIRKWFEVWRHKFINKNHYNYLCEVQRSITKKRYSSVTFNMRTNQGNSQNKAVSPAVARRSDSKSPTKRGQSAGGILRNARELGEVFRNLTNDY